MSIRTTSLQHDQRIWKRCLTLVSEQKTEFLTRKKKNKYDMIAYDVPSPLQQG